MNYCNPAQLFQLDCSLFVPEFERQHPGVRWADVEKRIHVAIRQMMEVIVVVTVTLCGVLRDTLWCLKRCIQAR
jgi:hypothetical protein